MGVVAPREKKSDWSQAGRPGFTILTRAGFFSYHQTKRNRHWERPTTSYTLGSTNIFLPYWGGNCGRGVKLATHNHNVSKVTVCVEPSLLRTEGGWWWGVSGKQKLFRIQIQIEWKQLQLDHFYKVPVILNGVLHSESHQMPRKVQIARDKRAAVFITVMMVHATPADSNAGPPTSVTWLLLQRNLEEKQTNLLSWLLSHQPGFTELTPRTSRK